MRQVFLISFSRSKDLPVRHCRVIPNTTQTGRHEKQKLHTLFLKLSYDVEALQIRNIYGSIRSYIAGETLAEEDPIDLYGDYDNDAVMDDDVDNNHRPRATTPFTPTASMHNLQLDASNASNQTKPPNQTQ